MALEVQDSFIVIISDTAQDTRETCEKVKPGKPPNRLFLPEWQ